VGASGWTMPLDLGAKGSCQIGGNVATNAGGLRLMRYGSLHGSVLGLEVVTGDGVVLDMRNRLRKDNVGYDMKQLFIGSEGTLGVITRVVIQAATAPLVLSTAMFECPDWKSCLALVALARKHCGEILRALEFIDGPTMAITAPYLAAARGGRPGAALPFTASATDSSGVEMGGGPFFLFLETGGSNHSHDQDKLSSLLAAAVEGGLCTNGVVPDSLSAALELWRFREEASVAITARGHVFKYDLSFATGHMYDIVSAIRARVETERGWRQREDVRVVGYGHIGDGNIHLNVSTPARGAAFLPHVGADLEPYVYDATIAAGGSISAEHGVGQAKAGYMAKARPPAVLDAMRQMKRVFDPAGIMNPGKVLPVKVS